MLYTCVKNKNVKKKKIISVVPDIRKLNYPVSGLSGLFSAIRPYSRIAGKRYKNKIKMTNDCNIEI